MKFITLSKKGLLGFSILLLAISTEAFGMDFIMSENVLITSHLDKGYIELKIPYYRVITDKDEALLKNSYFTINSIKCFEFCSSNRYGDLDKWQSDSYRTYPAIWATPVSSELIKVIPVGQYATASDGSVSWTTFKTENDNAYATFRLYLNEKYLGKELNCKMHLNPDKDDDGEGYEDNYINKTKLINGVIYETPQITDPVFSETPGEYKVSFNLSPPPKSGSTYRWDNGTVKNYSQSPTNKNFAISEEASSHTLHFYHKVSDCQHYETTSSIVLPAYPQAKSFTLDQLENGDTKISWKVNIKNLGSNFINGDEFEVQRADNSNYINAVTIGRREYKESDLSYSITDKTSNENLNDTYHYRIRRTKSANNWGWNLCSINSIKINCKHKSIDSATVIMVNNIATIAWIYDDGNIWSANTTVIIERYNITNGGVREVLEVPADSLSGKSFSEELFQTCNKFIYKIYVKPGNSVYPTQSPVNVEGDDIVPMEFGKLLVVKASKGYFSDRTEISWKTDGLPLDYFTIKNRVYQSDESFNQIALVQGSNGAEHYQYSDPQSNPGIIYEYQIIGTKQCANVMVSTDTLTANGFRTPTGNIYGRVAFESGQAEQNVEVSLENDEGTYGKSLKFTSTDSARLDNSSFLQSNTESVTMQAWVSFSDLSGHIKILSKPNMYELGLQDSCIYFSAGNQTLKSSTTIDKYSSDSEFVHVSGIYSGDSLIIYINGKHIGSMKFTGVIAGNLNQFIIGENLEGYIDEVRVWNKTLDSEQIVCDYNRYITGGETGLIAYWTFNYATENEFYDRSYHNSNYNENHGHLFGTAANESHIPTNAQLAYKGITKIDGSYAIRAIPYSGNGTVYSVMPWLGEHNFEPQEEVRFIGKGSESFTVNFTDKSSFNVKGTVTYAMGTFPVKGVSFTVDGIVAMGENGTILMSGADGKFEITVPVGTHEVIATKANHTFENEGRITNSHLLDLNYQDHVSGLKIKDITTVKYIGRVAGGVEQSTYQLGHSLSTNNLADNIKVTLITLNPAYDLSSIDTIKVFNHFLPSSKDSQWSKTNNVKYSKESITIYPNQETGEFVAEIIPESFTVRVNVPGHDDIPGSGEDLNLSQCFYNDVSVHEYTDSLFIGSQWVCENYFDTVLYNKAQKFIKRYPPVIRISQFDNHNNKLAYFGDTVYTVKAIDDTARNVVLYKDGIYSFGRPVFVQNTSYYFQTEVFEKYVYNSADGNPKAGIDENEVPTKDATVKFINEMALVNACTIEADSNGIPPYKFEVNEPELTSALRSVTAIIYYGDDNNITPINWNESFEGIVLGAVQTGRDFVTGGPDRVLTVLRDPPGTNSYSYLEKGVSFNESKTCNWNVSQEGSESLTSSLGFDLVVWSGVGFGVIKTITTESDLTVGITHEETFSGNKTSENTTTTTTRFQTSDNPSYVGAEADVYVGYSTNITYGSTECVSIIPQSKYQEKPDMYQVYEAITPNTADWLIVKQTGLGAAQTFGTLFAYPQKHIEDRLLPEMEALRNNYLLQESAVDVSSLQSLSNNLDTTFYVSHLDVDDPNYGKSNTDKVFESKTDPYPNEIFNGASYQVIFPQNDDFNCSDTILWLNQSIENWRRQLALNEKAKLEATLLQNYSFQGGSPVEYSESISDTKTTTRGFDVLIGGNIQDENQVYIGANGFKLELEESISTSKGGESVSGTENNHCKGFVLSEDGDDYISVDVMREYNADTISTEQEDSFYSSFVFRTKAGATSCPYEGAYVTKYYEVDKHIIDEATKRIEVPEISVESNFIENIPSGGTGYFMLYLRNNSEIKQDNWYTLKIVDGSNPFGARLSVDGAPIANGLEFLVPAGETLLKTLEVNKGSVMNYDDVQITLQSQCQDGIIDTLTLSTHFTPSCSHVEITKPGSKWTYNTYVDSINEHCMDIRIGGFDVNYDCFSHIKLQYKTSAESDDAWKTIMKYYSDSSLYQEALLNGENAMFIDPKDAGNIKCLFKMVDLPDQQYDIRAVSICLINNEKIENISESLNGIKDTYCPRLFSSPKPANGTLSIEDDIRLNFNEKIAEGLLTANNFQIKGIRNGSKTEHSASVSFDGENDFMDTEFDKNMANKDITVEMWIKQDGAQNATLFNHGNINESIAIALTSDNHLQLMLGNNIINSVETLPVENGSWAHVAFVYSKEGYISAYYNSNEVISHAYAGIYNGIGNVVLGREISTCSKYFKGQMHNVRIWNKKLTSHDLKNNSLVQLSGNEIGLLTYYPMNRARGEIVEDKARGANMYMHGCNWSVPLGRAVSFNGTDSYLRINTGSSAVIKPSMDYTIEFWFKGEPGQTNATMLCNGKGDGSDMGGSENLFSVEYNAEGNLCFRNNGIVTVAEGNYLDNNWHHFAVAVSRTSGKGQLYVDGNMLVYFDSKDIGGIESSYMYMGARAWYEEGNTDTLNVDNCFRGLIDELTVWNLYKYEQQLNDNINKKPQGSEMGLLVYYPFEYYKDWQGLKELDFTLSDMKIQSNITNPVSDAKNIGAEQSTDTPPVIDRGPVVDLDFDFVVNDNALIIYLKENLAKIEKTIVSFTVDGIQDVNGNKNISPITWSAYIDRNMLKWSETGLTVSKPLNQVLIFHVQAINKSGAIQKYSIENIPSWMKVTPSRGSIDPNTAIDITFEIEEGLNIGTYNENIALVNSDNVSEVFDITVHAEGEDPNWEVCPNDYKYNMSVFAKLRINNIFSRDIKDKIAAFAKGQCIGVANVQYEERNDMWYAFLTLYSNQTSSENIVFKIWDASSGIVYLADAGKVINFSNNAIIGTPTKPQIFDAYNMIFQNIPINPGWNWISFNVNSPVLNSLNETLADMQWDSENFFKCETSNLSANYSQDKGRWIEQNQIKLGNQNMYKVSSSSHQNISTAGSIIKPSEISIDIKGNQWNYIGYLPSVQLFIDDALEGYDATEEDVIKSQDRFAIYSANIGWIGNLSYMEPGTGYMFYRKKDNDVSFYYPDNNGAMCLKGLRISSESQFVSRSYPENMNLIATTDPVPEINDKILAYSGKELISVTTPVIINNELLYFISIPGYRGADISFSFERNGIEIGKTKQIIPFLSNAVLGKAHEPVVLQFNNVDNNISVYPNPTDNDVTVSLITSQGKEINISLMDMTGKLLIKKHYSPKINGSFTAIIPCKHLKPGMYYVDVNIEGVSYFTKIEKIN